jgi:hypothetical protein
MTKKQWIDYVRLIVDPTGKSPRCRPEVIEWTIDKVYAQAVRTIPEHRWEDFDFITKEYTGQAATEDSTTGRYYVDLPAPLVAFSVPAEAVRHVNTAEGTDLDFVPLRETDWELANGLFSHDVATVIGYIPRQDKIWFTENMTSDIATAGLRLVLAIPFSSFDDDDTVTMPTGDVDVISMVLQILQGVQMPQLKTDIK